MDESTFVFLDEFLDNELYIFLNKCKEKILKFIWKEKNIEIIGKYVEQQESNYNTELWLEIPFDLPEIGYDSVVYKVLSEVEKDDLKWGEFRIWDGYLSIEISIYNYPDEIRNLDNEVIWTKENVRKEHRDIIYQKNKNLEQQKKMGKEFFRYSNELEIIKRENLNKKKRKEELMKKIIKRVEAGERYALYKKRLDEHMEYIKNYLEIKAGIRTKS